MSNIYNPDEETLRANFQRDIRSVVNDTYVIDYITEDTFKNDPLLFRGNNPFLIFRFKDDIIPEVVTIEVLVPPTSQNFNFYITHYSTTGDTTTGFTSVKAYRYGNTSKYNATYNYVHAWATRPGLNERTLESYGAAKEGIFTIPIYFDVIKKVLGWTGGQISMRVSSIDSYPAGSGYPAGTFLQAARLNAFSIKY